MSTQEPTLAEVFDAAMHSRMKEMFGGWLPARVESYDAGTNKASVQILILDDYEDESGERQTERFPIINDIPVGWPCVGGKRVMRSTVAAGDVVVLLFSSRPADKWLRTGGFVDPEDNRHHDINDAFILPFRLDFGATDSPAMLTFNGTEILAGGNSPLATKADVQALRDYVYAQFCAAGGHTHAVSGSTTTAITTVASGTTAPGVPPSNPSGTTILKGG